MAIIKSNLRNSDLGGLITHLCLTTEEYDLTTNQMWINSIKPKLYGYRDTFDEKVLGVKTKSNLEVGDEKFDFSTRGFIKLVDALTYYPDAEVRAHVQVIAPFVMKRGLSIVNSSYSAEIAYANGIVAQMEQADCQAAITAIPVLLSAYTAFKDGVHEFSNTYNDFLNKRTDEDVEKTATETKKEILPFLNHTVLPFFKMMCGFQPDPYRELYERLEDLVEQSNRVVLSRMKKEEEEGDEPSNGNER